MLQLSDGTISIVLPDSIEWIDEFGWSSVQQDKQYTLGDNLVVSENNVTKGRPITLVSGDDVWVDRSIVTSLMTLVNIVDKTYTLTLPDTRTFSVKFNRESNPVIAKPVWRKSVQDGTSPYTITLNLMEV